MQLATQPHVAIARDSATQAAFVLPILHAAGTTRALDGHMGRVRALVADDNDDLLAVVSHIIERMGVEVVTASTGGELLERLANDGPFDLVVTDVAMPWMTGLHVVHSARAAGSTCPVVVMTALRDQRTSAQVGALGSNVRLLLKPFALNDLEDAVRASLETTTGESRAPQLPLAPRT